MNRKITVFLVLLSAFALLFSSASAAPPALEKLQQKFDEAKERYQNAKDKYLDAKERWQNALQKFKRSRKNSDLNEALDRVKEFMLRSTEHMQRYLETLKARMEKIADLSDADKAEISAKIDAETAKLEALKSDINRAQTKEQLTEAMKKAKAEWDAAKGFTKKITGLILVANTNKLISKAEQIATKVEAKIAALDANGADTTQLKSLLAEYKSKLDLAKQKTAAAKAKFLEITDVQGANDLFKQAHDLLKEAQQYVKEARGKLKDIIKQIAEKQRSSNASDKNES